MLIKVDHIGYAERSNPMQYMCVYMYVCTYVCRYVGLCVDVWICMEVHVYVCMYVSMYVGGNMYVLMYVSIHACIMDVCMSRYVEREREREREREGGGWRGRAGYIETRQRPCIKMAFMTFMTIYWRYEKVPLYITVWIPVSGTTQASLLLIWADSIESHHCMLRPDAICYAKNGGFSNLCRLITFHPPCSERCPIVWHHTIGVHGTRHSWASKSVHIAMFETRHWMA